MSIQKYTKNSMWSVFKIRIYRIFEQASPRGIFLVDDSHTSPPKKCPFSKIDFHDVSDDSKQKKIIITIITIGAKRGKFYLQT